MGDDLASAFETEFPNDSRSVSIRSAPPRVDLGAAVVAARTHACVLNG